MTTPNECQAEKNDEKAEVSEATHSAPLTDLDFIRLAIAEAAKCVGEDERSHPKVGAVVVKDGKVLGVAHRGECAAGDHAEYTALEKKLSTESLAGATVYTTLEPCTSRSDPKVPCAQRLWDRRVKRVVIGMLDPNPLICGRGLWQLRESGVETDLFPHAQMSEVEDLNREFIRAHRPRSATATSDATLAPSTIEPIDKEETEWTIFTTLFESAESNDFTAAERALKDLQGRRGDDPGKERLQIMYWYLKAKHAQDPSARKSLEEVVADSSNSSYARGLLASLEEDAGNTDSAVSILLESMTTCSSRAERIEYAIRAAQAHQNANETEKASSLLRSVWSGDLGTDLQAALLEAMADLFQDDGDAMQRATLLSRAASLAPSNRNQFQAGYALSKAGADAEAALHYELALQILPSDGSSQNNIGAAFERLGMPGLAVAQYGKSAANGQTLAMANLAQRLVSAGFLAEAEDMIKKGRTAEKPHANIGSAMVSLSAARSAEDEKWKTLRRRALSHKKAFHELASAIMEAPQITSGAWSTGAATTTLAVVGQAVEAAWEESGKRRRLRARIVGRAIFGTMEQWREYWKDYEELGSVCMVVTPDGELSGLLLRKAGEVQPISWKKQSAQLGERAGGAALGGDRDSEPEPRAR